MKAQYLIYLEAIRIYEICFQMFVLSEKTLNSYNRCSSFFVFKYCVLETQLKIEFFTPNNGA